MFIQNGNKKKKQKKTKKQTNQKDHSIKKLAWRKATEKSQLVEHECTHEIGECNCMTVFETLYLLYWQFMPGKTNIFLKTKEKNNPKQNRNPQGVRARVGIVRELTFILRNFITNIKIPSSQKASDFQHENHYPPSGPFTFLVRAGVSPAAAHLHLASPLHPLRPPGGWGSPAAAASQVSRGSNSGGALQGNNSRIIYATSCFSELDFFQMGYMM